MNKSSFGKSLLKRILSLIIVMFGVMTLSFCLQIFAGTDPAETVARNQNVFATEQQIEELRSEMGLDAPFHERYLTYMKGILKGDLGTAITNKKPVSQNIKNALPITSKLIAMAMILVIIFTIFVTIISVILKDSILDNIIRIICIIGICIPSFWFALILLKVFAVDIPIFKVMVDGSLKSLVLPSIAMAFPVLCISIRVLRASILNELKSDYVTYAKARGLSNSKIIYGEVLRNALPSVITLFAQYFAVLFGTSALVESVFSIQGLGSYVMESCEAMDIYGISGSILVIAILFVLVNTLADVLSSIICPAYRRRKI